MKLTVERFTSDNDTTLSSVYLDGVFQCFGLEDEFRAEKVAKETRIPAGTYKMGVRTVGSFHEKYKNHRRYGRTHQGMLEVLQVPNFKFILIHVGNTDEDTAGCLLVGTGAVSGEGNMSVGSSADAYTQLYPKVIVPALAGNLEIEYLDRDQPA